MEKIMENPIYFYGYMVANYVSYMVSFHVCWGRPWHFLFYFNMVIHLWKLTMGIQMIMDSKTMPHTIVYNRTLDLKANEMWFFANAISTVLQKKKTPYHPQGRFMDLSASHRLAAIYMSKKGLVLWKAMGHWTDRLFTLFWWFITMLHL